MKNKFENKDCMLDLKEYPDNLFDLAIVDPPYGIGADVKNSKKELKSRHSLALSTNYGNQKWDGNIPTREYFLQLKRISKKQIIWGANYYNLTGGMLYWHKNVTMPTYSTGELAWLSWLTKINYVNITWHGMLQENMKNKELRIHPTQKPVALYIWLLNNYAKKGDLILDTHVGSASSLIACEKMGFSYVGYEIDIDYYNTAQQRLKVFRMQTDLFKDYQKNFGDITRKEIENVATTSLL